MIKRLRACGCGECTGLCQYTINEVSGYQTLSGFRPFKSGLTFAGTCWKTTGNFDSGYAITYDWVGGAPGSFSVGSVIGYGERAESDTFPGTYTGTTAPETYICIDATATDGPWASGQAGKWTTFTQKGYDNTPFAAPDYECKINGTIPGSNLPLTIGTHCQAHRLPMDSSSSSVIAAGRRRTITERTRITIKIEKATHIYNDGTWELGTWTQIGSNQSWDYQWSSSFVHSGSSPVFSEGTVPPLSVVLDLTDEFPDVTEEDWWNIAEPDRSAFNVFVPRAWLYAASTSLLADSQYGMLRCTAYSATDYAINCKRESDVSEQEPLVGTTVAASYEVDPVYETYWQLRVTLVSVEWDLTLSDPTLPGTLGFVPNQTNIWSSTCILSGNTIETTTGELNCPTQSLLIYGSGTFTCNHVDYQETLETETILQVGGSIKCKALVSYDGGPLTEVLGPFSVQIGSGDLVTVKCLSAP